jgi:hypothetical protein
MVISPVIPRRNPSALRLHPNGPEPGSIEPGIMRTLRRPTLVPSRSAGRRGISSPLISRFPFRMIMMQKASPQLDWNHIDANLLDLKSPVLKLIQNMWGAGRTESAQNPGKFGSSGVASQPDAMPSAAWLCVRHRICEILSDCGALPDSPSLGRPVARLFRGGAFPISTAREHTTYKRN